MRGYSVVAQMGNGAALMVYSGEGGGYGCYTIKDMARGLLRAGAIANWEGNVLDGDV